MNFLQEIGLESTSLNTNLAGDEITAELAGLESLTDLATSLIQGDIENSIEAINYNKVALVDNIAGIEGVNVIELLNQMEFDEIGMESLKESGARAYYRVKAIAQQFLKSVITFFKKLVSMGGMTDKAANALMAKYEKVRTRYDENIGKVKMSSTNKVSTWITNHDPNTGKIPLKGITEPILETAKLVESGDLKKFLGSLNVQNAPALLRINKASDKTIKKADESLDKEFKKNAEKLYKVKDVAWLDFKSSVGAALNTVKDIATELEDFDVFAKAKEGITDANAILKELGSLKQEDIAETLGKVSPQNASNLATGVIKTLTELPKTLAKTIKFYLTFADKTFTEVEKLLSNI